jgi:hypothetical protein
MGDILAATVWLTPEGMLSALSCGSPNDLAHRLALDRVEPGAVADLRWAGPTTQPEGDEGELLLDIEVDGLSLVLKIEFPTALEALQATAQWQLSLAERYASGRRTGPEVVDDLHELQSSQGVDDLSGLAEWLFDSVLGGRIGATLTPGTWADSHGSPGTGTGIEVLLDFFGRRAQAFLEFPLAVGSATLYLDELAAGLQSDWLGDAVTQEPEPVFARFPFLVDVADDFADHAGQRLSICRTQADLEAIADAWALTRIQAVLDALGPSGRAALDLDLAAAARDLSAAAIVDIWDDYPAYALPPSAPPPQRDGAHLDPRAGRETWLATLISTRPHAGPAVLAAILLFIAPADHPYGYFEALRWVACLSSLLVLWVLAADWSRQPSRERKAPGLIVFGSLAVLFNPIAPITMQRGHWLPVDVIAGLAFAISVLGVSRPASPAPSD